MRIQTISIESKAVTEKADVIKAALILLLDEACESADTTFVEAARIVMSSIGRGPVN